MSAVPTFDFPCFDGKKVTHTHCSHLLNILPHVLPQGLQPPGPVMKLQQRTHRRRGQQPKLLNSPEDSLYYNQLNRTLDYQGSKRKPRKLGELPVVREALCCLSARITTHSLTEAELDLTLNFTLNTGIVF
ncbi:hypothetical protein PAMP_003840 [Pampus punctatissimus]